MADIPNPHDKFFKEVFSHPDVVHEFLFHYLPKEIHQHLEPQTIVPLKDSFIDHTLQEQFSDLLFSVQLKTKQELYLYVLFEHKSYPEPLIAFHLLRYLVKIWEYDLNEKKAPPFHWILPIVVYHGKEHWKIGEEFQALFKPVEDFAAFLPNFRYELFDITRFADDEIQGTPRLQVALMLMKYIFHRDLRNRLGRIFQWIQELSQSQSIQDFLETVLLYLLNSAEKITLEDIKPDLENAFTDKGVNSMSTIAEKLRMEGWKKGKQEGWKAGKQEGWKEGKQEGWKAGKHEGWKEGEQEGWIKGNVQKGREDILEILETRFYKVPSQIPELLNQIQEPALLKQWLKASITVDSIDEFLQILSKK